MPQTGGPALIAKWSKVSMLLIEVSRKISNSNFAWILVALCLKPEVPALIAEWSKVSMLLIAVSQNIYNKDFA